MGTFTAHIALGSPNESGIIPSHEAWLWENSRPAWFLEPTQGRLTGGKPDRTDRPGSLEPIRWIPEGPDHILEDGLLLLAMHALGDKDVLDLADELLPELADTDTSGLKPGADLFRDLHVMSLDNPTAGQSLLALRELSTTIPWAKLVVTVLGDCSLRTQLQTLERYPMDVEVCTVSYSRLRPSGVWSSGTGDQVIRGSLAPGADAPNDH